MISPLGVNPFGCLGCQMKEKSIRNWNLLIFCSTFQSKLNENKKSYSKINIFEIFLLDSGSFSIFIHFALKVEQILHNFVFLVLFCFFWHSNCPQGCTPTGLNKIIMKSPSVKQRKNFSTMKTSRKNKFSH